MVLGIVRVLLRHGASLNLNYRNVICSAEDKLVSFEHKNVRSDDESVVAIKALVAGVRKHGTYKRYMRAPHRDVLACRGLAQRGKLSTEHRTLIFLARLGDNGVCWHILTYWRPTE